MQASQWEFASAADGGLRLGARPSAERRTKTNRGQRQSGLAVLYTAARRLPFCSAAAAGVVSLAVQLLPRHIRWTVGAWSAGLMTLAFAVGSAAVSWWLNRWQLNDRRLTVISGVLTRRATTIHRAAILSAELETTPFTALFRCSRLYIRTAQRGERRPLRLLMSTRDGVMLSGQLMPEQSLTEDADRLTDGPRSVHTYRADRRSLLLAAVGGEGLAAFVAAYASGFSLLRDSVRTVLGDQLPLLLPPDGEHLPVGVIGTVSLGVIWLLKAAHTLLTHAGMTCTLCGGLLVISRGVISRRSFRLRAEGVCAIDRRQSMPALLTGRQSSTLLMRSGHSCHLLPPVDRRRSRIETAVIMPRGRRVCAVSAMLSPIAFAWGRWAVCLGVLPLTSLLQRMFPSWTATVLAAGMWAAAVLMWRALITTVSARRSGLSLYTDCVEVTAVRRLTIHTLRIFRPSVGMIRVTQSPIGRAEGRCSVRVVPRGGSADSSPRCIKLPVDRAMAACERLV
ncbi:MAG: hypothetical protein E7554_04205 [Ruminococcaceae bacterium]|nr:hypothetical protein [Oscillospiraceae bacterium]